MIKINRRRYDYITGDYANANSWLCQLVDEPHIQYLHIFYEDCRYEDKEISFTLNLN